MRWTPYTLLPAVYTVTSLDEMDTVYCVNLAYDTNSHVVCRIRNWHLDSVDGVNAVSESSLACGAGATGVMSVAASATGCTVEASEADTAGSSTASVVLTVTLGSVVTATVSLK